MTVVRAVGTAAFLLALLVTVAGCGGGGAGPVAVDVIDSFGATADGVTDDEPAIQAAIDYVASSGGGTVVLRPAVYGIARPLILGSNVRLQGAGHGKSILRSVVPSLGKIVAGTGVWAAVATVAAHDAAISDLTVDLRSARTHANGIAFLPSGGSFEGPVSSNCKVSGVEVLGAGDLHAYMIWNLRGENIEIVDNIVDGGVISPVPLSFQEGIESYGGRQVLVKDNIIQNVGNAALNFGSAGLPDTGVDGLEVVGNRVSNAGRGLNIGPWMDPSGPQNVARVRIAANEFQDVRRTGIYVSVARGTRVSDLRIEGNTIHNVGATGEVGATGIQFQGTPTDGTLPAGMATGIVVSQNAINNVTGLNAVGVLMNFFPDLTLDGNTISDIAGPGLQAIETDGLTVSRNTVARVGEVGLIGRGGSLHFVRDNQFEQWDLKGRLSAAVSIDSVNVGDILANRFTSASPVGSAIRVEAAASDFVVFGNRLSVPEAPTEPFVNLGSASNTGSLHADAGLASVSIDIEAIRPGARINVWSASGTLGPILTSVEVGHVVLSFEAPLPEDLDLRYEVAHCGMNQSTIRAIGLDC